MNNPNYVTETPVEIIAVLDRSGSMQSIVDDAIGGFNRFLEEQKNLPGEAKLTMVLFDNQYEEPVKQADVRQVKPLDRTTFVPRGMTALYDALGRSLTELHARNPKRAIVVILTDGMENASHEFTLSTVSDLIKQAQQKDWGVVYLAANQDAFKVGEQLGVLRSATANFAATGQGVTAAYDTANTVTLNYRNGGAAEIEERK